MKLSFEFFGRLMVLVGAVILGGCAAQSDTLVVSAPVDTPAVAESAAKFERDREAILAMAGNYKVTFNFTETVPFVAGYELKDPYVTGGHEVVRVIEDRGEYISLQHILVVGGDEKFPVKHWRQDWIYEPDSVLVFIGGNAWEKRPVSDAEARGKWAQVVYQVDDAPRYGALAAWTHANGMSEWDPPAEWRPLPRRDATKRDDYHTIAAVNRHAITPSGWVHEQDNAKLILTDEPPVLVREIGVNTYTRFDDFEIAIADDYWAATEDYWAAVRAEWARIEAEHDAFGLSIKGEPEELYMKLLTLADEVETGEKTERKAIRKAREIIGDYTTTRVGDLAERLNPIVREARN